MPRTVGMRPTAEYGLGTGSSPCVELGSLQYQSRVPTGQNTLGVDAGKATLGVSPRMSATITNWPLKLEQFLSLPEAEPALEMGCNGEISQKVPATTTHSLLQGNITMSLAAH